MMTARPAQLRPEIAARFREEEVVAAYRHRPLYPPETFTILTSLITDPPPHAVLDVGCGSGNVARPLAPRVDRLDALDISPAMIAAGKMLPGGDYPHLHWLLGHTEDAPLHPPYALITAGASLHWMEWAVVMPRFAELLTPNGFLAVVHVSLQALPWRDALRELDARYTTIPEHQEYHLRDELTARGLFDFAGERETAPVSWSQPMDDYIEAQHSHSRMTRAAMGAAAADAYDAALRALLAPYAVNGALALAIIGRVWWGRPHAPAPIPVRSA